MRQFEDMKKHFEDQIADLNENFVDSDNFIEDAVESQRNDFERHFRNKGKTHKSIIGRNNSGVKSMDFCVGGELHNEIGISNNILEKLFDDLKSEDMEEVCDNIKTLLDSPKSAGGLGCSPGHHHGGHRSVWYETI